MGLFGNLFRKEAPASQPPPSTHEPSWLVVDGEWVDLHALGPARLAALEVYLLSQRRQREEQFLEYLRSLAVERERLLATQDAALWLMTLKLMYGEELGRRVAAQDVGPGMQLQHVIMGFGTPDQVDASGPRVLLLYGPDNLFELDGEHVSRAIIRQRPSLPLGFTPGAETT